jgi:hypothetical protein
MASSLLLRNCRAVVRGGSSPARCLATYGQSYGPITDELRDLYTPLHPSLKLREVDDGGRGKKGRPVETKVC